MIGGSVGNISGWVFPFKQPQLAQRLQNLLVISAQSNPHARRLIWLQTAWRSQSDQQTIISQTSYTCALQVDRTQSKRWNDGDKTSPILSPPCCQPKSSGEPWVKVVQCQVSDVLLLFVWRPRGKHSFMRANAGSLYGGWEGLQSMIHKHDSSKKQQRPDWSTEDVNQNNLRATTVRWGRSTVCVVFCGDIQCLSYSVMTTGDATDRKYELCKWT